MDSLEIVSLDSLRACAMSHRCKLRQALGAPTCLQVFCRPWAWRLGLGFTPHLWRRLFWYRQWRLGIGDEDICLNLLVTWWNPLASCVLNYASKIGGRLSVLCFFISRLREFFPVVWDNSFDDHRGDRHAKSLACGICVGCGNLLMQMHVTKLSWRIIVGE